MKKLFFIITLINFQQIYCDPFKDLLEAIYETNLGKFEENYKKIELTKETKEILFMEAERIVKKRKNIKQDETVFQKEREAQQTAKKALISDFMAEAAVLAGSIFILNDIMKFDGSLGSLLTRMGYAAATLTLEFSFINRSESYKEITNYSEKILLNSMGIASLKYQAALLIKQKIETTCIKNTPGPK